MRTIAKATAIVFVSLFAISCIGNHESNSFSYIPFKADKADRWGLMDFNGKVLVEDEFKGMITPVCENIFFERKENNHYDMYSTDDPQKPIVEDLREYAAFYGNVAPSVRDYEVIKYIDKKGNTVFSLPAQYNSAASFNNGYSKIHDSENNFYDIVDEAGHITKFQKYSVESVLKSGRFLVYNKEELQEQNGGNGIARKFIIDKDENVITKYPTEARRVDPDSNPDVFIFRAEDDDDYFYGIKTLEGEVLVRAKYDDISIVSPKYAFVLNDDSGWGLLDYRKGEFIFKPSYLREPKMNGNRILVQNIKEHDCSVLDLKGDELFTVDCSELFFLPNTDNLLAKDKNDTYFFVDKNGKEVKGSDYYDVRYTEELTHLVSNSVSSDYFDIDDFVDKAIINDPIIKKYKAFIGKSPENVADALDLSLSYSDIKYSPYGDCFPVKYYYPVAPKVSSTNLTLFFNNVAERYAGGYRYSSYGKCKGFIYQISLSNAHYFPYIEENLLATLKKNGFTERPDYVYDNSDHVLLDNDKVEFTWNIEDDKLEIIYGE